MGFYLRKSISVGPIRFNLSKSGIGVSTGIKGFRVGSGPRGNYIHMGRGGIYFRQTIPNVGDRRIPLAAPPGQASSIDFKEIESGCVSQMADSSSAALLEEINSKSKTVRIWPLIVVISICALCAIAAMDSPIWGYVLAIPLCVGGIICATYFDKLRKTVVLFYNLEPHVEEAYQNLHSTFDVLRSCSQVWHVGSKGDITNTHDWKVNSGAGHLVKRQGIAPYIGSPPYFRSNIAIPVLPAGRQLLYFLPDRILVWDTNGVGAVSFDQLEVGFNERRFIEDDRVPKDAKVVDKTWKYVNKKGGPDRRFNNNYEIPIALYEEVFLTSKSGLRELFQTSRTGMGEKFRSAVKLMASEISRVPPSEVPDSFIKCSCNNCDGFIEFPVHGVGRTIACPHCGLDTILFQPSLPM